MENKSLSNTFGKNLRIAMAVRNIKTGKLHEMSGVSITTIMALEYGHNKGVQFETITKLANALEIEPQELFKDEEK